MDFHNDPKMEEVLESLKWNSSLRKKGTLGSEVKYLALEKEFKGRGFTRPV